ncbi:ABC transporter ATP-binding protein [Massilimicrobiota timonensis]|uniref:ABC transporter ATP-binding protein n=1 Tax=Bacillota TaxID=1239 RepID=UPI001BA706CC|nr:ABC transporter ATP-binding protein [Clostridium sp. C1]QUN12117.1 ABC transporter ATP-binding protein [Clostridium sp. C1]
MDFAIEIEHLTKVFKDFSLNHVSLKIPKGTVVGIIGENGAGKSTLIQSILGIVDSQYDKLTYFGKDFKQNEKNIKEDLAVIFDTTHYDLELTPRWIERILSHTFQNWNHELYQSYLQKFELPYDKKIKLFSRGMKMKLEFAIAFSHDAKILILDEATSGLDPIIRDEILNLIRAFTEDENHTVLISSHITSDLDKIADYIVYLYKGKCIFMQTYDEMNENYGIIHGTKDLLNTLSQDDIVAYIQEPYSISILVKNRQQIQSVFQDLEITRPTIEEIMLFYAKGVKEIC